MEVISSKIIENPEDKPNKFLESLQSKLSGNVLNKIRKSGKGHSAEVHVSTYLIKIASNKTERC